MLRARALAFGAIPVLFVAGCGARTELAKTSGKYGCKDLVDAMCETFMAAGSRCAPDGSTLITYASSISACEIQFEPECDAPDSGLPEQLPSADWAENCAQVLRAESCAAYESSLPNVCEAPDAASGE